MTDHTSTAKLSNIPQPIREVASEFYADGYTFWLVGGYVRDILMERASMDVDATTNARPHQISRVLSRLGADALYNVGAKYGTIACQYKGYDIEVTTYRADKYREGSRHPEVQFGQTLNEDLDRRDFTINALAYALPAGPLVDLHDGVRDIEDKIIRTIGNPTDRIEDDPLRILRAVRLARQLDFSIEVNTSVSIYENAHLVQELSQERVRDELTKILLSEKPALAMIQLRQLGILKYILPEINDLYGVPQRTPYHSHDVWVHTLETMIHVPSKLSVRLAALFHDTGKVETRGETVQGNVVRDTFYGHEIKSATLARQALRRLRFPSHVVEQVANLCTIHMYPLQMYNNWPPTKKQLRRFLHKCHNYGVDWRDLMTLNRADVLAHAEPELTPWYQLSTMLDDVWREGTVETARSPLDGNELLDAYGMEPGPWVGGLKMYLEGLVIDGDLQEYDKEVAWELADNWMITKYKSMRTV